jgi:hypothetical protein
MRSRTIIRAISVAFVALLSAGNAGAVEEMIHLEGVVDDFDGTGNNFSFGDPFEATVTIDTTGDPVFFNEVNNLAMAYTLTIGSYSASGFLPAEFQQAFLVYENHNFFGDGVSIEETGATSSMRRLSTSVAPCPFRGTSVSFTRVNSGGSCGRSPLSPRSSLSSLR